MNFCIVYPNSNKLRSYDAVSRKIFKGDTHAATDIGGDEGSILKIVKAAYRLP